MPRPALLLALLVTACGEKTEPAATAAGDGGGKSLSGCLELWNGPHVGSTRLQYVARRQTIYARVAVRGGRCEVAFASRDGKVYGRYVEKENAAGPWTLDAERAPVSTAKRIVSSANATGRPDGTLQAGAPG